MTGVYSVPLIAIRMLINLMAADANACNSICPTTLVLKLIRTQIIEILSVVYVLCRTKTYQQHHLPH